MYRFLSLQKHVLSRGNFIPARVEAAEKEPTYYVPVARRAPSKADDNDDDDSFVQVGAGASEDPRDERRRRLGRMTDKGRHPGGCYRVCPQPVIFRNGEPYGGPFGPDPFYSYGNNHMY
jgi:hypothetical protein